MTAIFGATDTFGADNVYVAAPPVPVPAMVRVGVEATETPGLVQRIAAIDPLDAVPPTSASETVACVMPLEMLGSNGDGTITATGAVG